MSAQGRPQRESPSAQRDGASVTARRFVVVPAAGGGSRFGGALPKQYAELAGRPVIAHALDRLAALQPAATLVVLAPDDAHYARLIGVRAGVEAVAAGGVTRAATVANALAHLAGRCADDDWILVHDAARPCVPRSALRRLVDQLDGDPVGGLLAIPVADTLKRAAPAGEGGGEPRVRATEDRAGLWQAQTPQMFRCGVLRAALARPEATAATDEAAAVEGLAATLACAMPRLIRGSARNIKITYAADLALAVAILSLPDEEA
jgi:2-C-methyl-D-erythritol 4-phosphate cytidylyltransferase